MQSLFTFLAPYFTSPITAILFIFGAVVGSFLNMKAINSDHVLIYLRHSVSRNSKDRKKKTKKRRSDLSIGGEYERVWREDHSRPWQRGWMAGGH